MFLDKFDDFSTLNSLALWKSGLIRILYILCHIFLFMIILEKLIGTSIKRGKKR